MADCVTIQENDFDAAELTRALRNRTAGQAGAIVAFTGYVRDYAPDAPTHTLFLDHYPGMCEREINALCDTARSRWDIADCRVVHRVGELHHTEQIVYVGVASAHRGQAFQACQFIIDTLKTRAPFWKRETLGDGRQFWVEQRESDARKTASWQAAAAGSIAPEPAPHDGPSTARAPAAAPDKSAATLNVAVMTISDTRGPEDDSAGDYLVSALTQAGHANAARAIVPNATWKIRKALCDWLVQPGIDVILVNGGTGFSHDKATIPAVRPLLEQHITGFGELFRHLSYLDIGSSSLQSDALAGLANGKLVFCIPGSPGACRLAWDGILRAQLDSRQKPCNFATMFA